MIRRPRLLLATAMVMSATACDDDSPTMPSNRPAAPTGVSAQAGETTVTVRWSSSASSHTVERRAPGRDFIVVANDVAGTSYTDSGLEPGTYMYRVVAVAGTLRSPPSESVSVQFAQANLAGVISGTRTLHADTTYVLQGIVSVADGGELRIPAGTTLLGGVAVQPTALIVRTGGKLFSEGTAEAPVVFTSASPPGERRAGDWGGVVVNGKSLCNFPAGECVGESSSGTYGGGDRDDDSGVIRYTRIEFAGYEVSFGNELNALTLNGVGAGTTIEYVQTNVGLDDGIEFFGGTVDLKYAIVTNASDDSFDYSTGWQGRGQFWIAQQDPADADNGFEADGNEDDYGARPFTAPVIYNVTLVGGGPGSTESRDGLRLRRGTAGTIYNAVVTGFGEAGLDIDSRETLINGLEVRNSVLAANEAAFSADDDAIDEEDFFFTAGWANRVVDDAMLASPYDRTAPDFTPLPGSPLLTGAAVPPRDGFFDATDFVGAVAPDGPKWWAGWTSFARN